MLFKDALDLTAIFIILITLSGRSRTVVGTHVSCQLVLTGNRARSIVFSLEAADNVTTEIGTVRLPISAINFRKLSALFNQRVRNGL